MSTNLASTYALLKPDASVDLLPVTSDFWERIAAGQLGTFHNEFLVTVHSSEADWPMWEMHPKGDEIVCLLEGAVTFVLERNGRHESVDLSESGAYVLVPRGTWHTARVKQPTRMLFITAGEDTQHR